MAEPINFKGFQTMVGTPGKDLLDATQDAVELYGLAGDDTYIVDGDDTVVEAAGAGTDTVVATGLASYTLPDNVENLTLDGTTTGTGNALKNVLIGDGDDNILNGGAEADSMSGGLGSDTYYVDNTGDKVTENASEGSNDLVISSVTYTLGANVEDLTLTGAGNLNGTGNTLANVITGNAGNNNLVGGDEPLVNGLPQSGDTISGGLGNDTLTGGKGNDALSGGDGNDKLDGGDDHDELDGGAGNDTLMGVAGNDDMAGGNGNDSLDGGLGNDTLEGDAGDDTLMGGAGNDELLDDSGANKLDGGDGDDYLQGGDGADTLLGGAGNDEFNDTSVTADSMVGGAGDDSYYVDHLLDKTVEAAAGGSDSVYLDVDNLGAAAYVLQDNVENLHLVGAYAAFMATGNKENNYLEGHDGDDTLIGLDGDDALHGGAGVDSMVGGKGSDSYVVDEDGDQVVELAADTGTDTVYSQLDTFSLAEAGREGVENLRFTGHGPNDGVGNALNNLIIGNLDGDGLEGGAGNDTLDGGGGADFLLGGTGNDTYLFDNTGDVAIELKGEGTDTVLSSVSIPNLDNNVENATLTGTADINVTGNGGVNVLTGNDGNNQLDGSRDASLIDDLRGGKGNDTYFLRGSVADKITENASEGTDTVVTVLTYTLGANLENLQLDNEGGNINGTGNALNNLISGNTGTNSLKGDAGNDTLYGHAGDDNLYGDAGNDLLDGGMGMDAMFGGAGDDTYYVNIPDDKVHEASAGGTDTVFSFVDFYLTTGGASLDDNHTNVENLTLLGSATEGTGNALANILTGNAQANDLEGNAGDDKLYGLGGNDSLTGGNGKDSLDGGDGDDTLTGDDTLPGSAGDDTLLGGAGDDVLDGGAGNDRLDGGTGADTLTGGLGNDTYILDDVNDTVGTEDTIAGGGTDIVFSSVTHTLRANYENLTLTGSGHVHASGNTGKNILIGNDGNNELDGNTDADDMKGGKGDDTYYVDNLGDKVTENANEGTDSVESSVTFTLGANVEHLQLVDAGNVNGTGNVLDNDITGNDGKNILDGAAGHDTLRGGLENDTLKGGDGNDSLSGDAGNDSLDGGAGNDTLNGGSGNDSMLGGAGDDLYMLDNSLDTVTEAASAGTDTIKATDLDVNLTLATRGGGNVENLELTSTGANITGTGTDAANLFTLRGAGDITANGGKGNDTIQVLDNTGNAAIDGGEGNDSLIFQSGTLDGDDTVIGGLGTDTMSASVVDLTAALDISGVETVQFRSLGTANTIDADWTRAVGDVTTRIDLMGHATLHEGADITLDNLDSGLTIGLSDALAVTLNWADATGGADSQQFVLNNAGDVEDDIPMSLTIADVEQLKFSFEQTGTENYLYLAGVTGATDLLFTGGGNNVGAIGLVGLHGDTQEITFQDVITEAYLYMDGFATDLTINLDNAAVALAETDTSLTQITLDTTGSGGASMVYLGPDGADDGVDPATDLVLTGGQNVRLFDVRQDIDASTYSGVSRIDARVDTAGLDFAGGSARDLYFGGSGDDSLAGNAGDDRLDGNNGNDTLAGGADEDDLRGGGGGDTLDGGGENDRLAGGGGHDTLTGGAGNDVFVFEHSGASHSDTVTDYDNDFDNDGGADMIGIALTRVNSGVLEATEFTFGGAFSGLTAGASAGLNPDFFVEGTDAADANDYLIWDTALDQLWYDADANGIGAKALIATLTFSDVGDDLTAGDIMVLG